MANVHEMMLKAGSGSRRALFGAALALGVFAAASAAHAQSSGGEAGPPAPAAPPAVAQTVVATPAQPAAAPVFRPPFVLNSHAPHSPVTNLYGGPEVDQNASAASDGAGNWVAVWHSSDAMRGPKGRDYDILVSRSVDGGVTWTRQTALNRNATDDIGDDLTPIVRTNEGGVWVAVWSSNETFGGQYGLDRDLFVARSTDNGETWSEPVPLNVNAGQDWGDDVDPRLATDGSDKWVAVWSSNDSLANRIGGDKDILVSRSSDGGLTWTHPMPLNNNATEDKGFDTSPDVVTDASGRWLAAWSAGDSGIQSIGTDRDILIARSDDDGATWSDPAPLNSNAWSDENSDWTPRLASDGRGTWLAVWSSADSLNDTIGVDRDILVSRSTDNGTTWTAARALNRNAAIDSREDSAPSMVSDGMGNWLVAWHAWGGLLYSDGSDADIAIAYSADDGLTWSETTHVNERADVDALDDLLPSLATDGAGHWLALWQAFHAPDETVKTSEWRVLASAGRIAGDASGATGNRTGRGGAQADGAPEGDDADPADPVSSDGAAGDDAGERGENDERRGSELGSELDDRAAGELEMLPGALAPEILDGAPAGSLADEAD